MFRLAHVTDPHFRGWGGARPREFLGKRAIGLANLVVSRVRKHKMQLLDDLRVDLRAQAPDHLALTGDLSNVALGGEWRAALAWIDLSGVPPEGVSVIPGNHDAYVESVVKERTFERLFAAYQTSDLATDLPPHLATDLTPNLARRDDAVYPFVHLRDEVALIGVSSSVATGDLGAWGQVGTAQLERLEAILRSPELTGKTRVVLIHHPPVLHKAGEHRNLRDREAFAAVLARAGAELVLHGHDHEDQRAQLPGPDGRPIPIIGAGSASYAGGPERRSRYSLYEIEGGAITWTSRVHDEASDTFHERRRERL
ncbi:MAG TPA: metallophosphoesterase [Polyangia bacterium]|nr:metallophosphoesterase [Polyangia bacterium]